MGYWNTLLAPTFKGYGRWPGLNRRPATIT
jgi:hypothetical protein